MDPTIEPSQERELSPEQVEPRADAHSTAPASARTPARTSRRALLAHLGSAAVAVPLAATIAAAPKVALAQQPPQPSMRSPWKTVLPALADTPPLPALEVIALNRMGFGPRPGDLAAFRALAATPEARLQSYVEQQLNPATIDDSACDSRLAALNFTTLAKSRAQLWTDHIVADNLPWEDRIRPANETMQATFTRAVYSKRQLVEVLADFWHNHFNVYGWDSWSAGTWVQYDRDALRANLFGNFRTMLGAVAQSPAMLYYLDNISNTSAGPNENYARELFELHGLGAENYFGVASIEGPNGDYRHPAPLGENGVASMYVDEDVYSATRCFTGWRIHEETGAFLFEDSVHDKYSKIVLAKNTVSGSGVQDGEFVLNLIANHPGTARYICRKLCKRLISDTPTEQVVQAAADVFHAQRNAPDQLKQVIRTILLSSEFSYTWGFKIKRPFEYVVSLMRATQANFAWSDWFRWYYEGMGQPMFGWRPPNGFPDRKEDWSSTMPMLQRWRVCNALLEWWEFGGEGSNKDERRINILAQTPATYATPAALVDYWTERMLGRPLPPEERVPIVEFMAAGRNPEHDLPADQIEERVRFMAALILMSPSFQWR